MRGQGYEPVSRDRPTTAATSCACWSATATATRPARGARSSSARRRSSAPTPGAEHQPARRAARAADWVTLLATALPTGDQALEARAAGTSRSASRTTGGALTPVGGTIPPSWRDASPPASLEWRRVRALHTHHGRAGRSPSASSSATADGLEPATLGRFNVCPTEHDRGRRPRRGRAPVRTVRWGLVPSWAKALGKGLAADQRAQRDRRRPRRRSPS